MVYETKNTDNWYGQQVFRRIYWHLAVLGTGHGQTSDRWEPCILIVGSTRMWAGSTRMSVQNLYFNKKKFIYGIRHKWHKTKHQHSKNYFKHLIIHIIFRSTGTRVMLSFLFFSSECDFYTQSVLSTRRAWFLHSQV
jgi:hypothetical protein